MHCEFDLGIRVHSSAGAVILLLNKIQPLCEVFCVRQAGEGIKYLWIINFTSPFVVIK